MDIANKVFDDVRMGRTTWGLPTVIVRTATIVVRDGKILKDRIGLLHPTRARSIPDGAYELRRIGTWGD